MRSFHIVAGCVLAASVAGCGGKQVGGACQPTDALSCDSKTNVFACVAGTLASVPCGGPTGCTDSATGTFCDLTEASVGNACPPWAEGNQLCHQGPPSLITCAAGTWAQTETCSSCSTATGAAVCTGGTVVGGSDGGTCPVCASGMKCDATFHCVPAGCTAANCADGCCSNGQCVRPPTSPGDTACGPLGGACTNCKAIGLVCNPTLRSCQTSSTGGGTDAGDACMGVPPGGECVSATVVRFCAVSTGQGANTVKTYQCTGSATCTAKGNTASCVAPSSACTPGDQRCAGNALEQCGASGTWSAPSDCAPGLCRTSTIGAFCAPNIETISLTATLKYQARTAVIASDGTFASDWSTNPTALPARNLVVWSIVGNGQGAVVLDSATTSATGQYTVKVPKTPASGDHIAFIAAGGDSLGIRFLMEDPGFDEGTYPAGQEVTAPRAWSWAAADTNLTSGTVTTVTTAQGSGAINLFEGLQASYVKDQALHNGVAGLDVVVWFGLKVDWNCGSCFIDSPIDEFESQAFIGGGSSDQSYWGNAVIAHEIGHWAMASYGTSPAEGGTHIAGLKTFPGQAWSEGWATFHSSAIRQDPVYYDRQDGLMFWIDLAARQYNQGGAFGIMRTNAAGGMLQQIDENDVSAMLWQISNAAPSGLGQLHNALSSVHLNTSPWPSGYTRHEWDVNPNDGTKTNIIDTHDPSLHLGDMLDALRCDGMAASFIDSAAVPATYYPYASANPQCRTGFCYGCSSNNQCLPGNTSAACGSGGSACTSCTTSCSTGVCQ